jgi:hypothetical protein
MEIRLVPVDEALRMAREGEISDGLSALVLLWCEPLLHSGAIASQSDSATGAQSGHPLNCGSAWPMVHYIHGRASTRG